MDASVRTIERLELRALARLSHPALEHSPIRELELCGDERITRARSRPKLKQVKPCIRISFAQHARSLHEVLGLCRSGTPMVEVKALRPADEAKRLAGPRGAKSEVPSFGVPERRIEAAELVERGARDGEVVRNDADPRQTRAAEKHLLDLLVPESLPRI